MQNVQVRGFGSVPREVIRDALELVERMADFDSISSGAYQRKWRADFDSISSGAYQRKWRVVLARYDEASEMSGLAQRLMERLGLDEPARTKRADE